MTKRKPKVWQCFECDTTGEEPTKELAFAAWDAHWLARHQGVPWMP
jgi:hypothetical protein